ncbi:MAG TPA: YihY/virulence factor BrkB family protein [Anaerolineales bacterium]
MALWRAFWHDALGIAKGAAYSSVLSLFPSLMLVASILAAFRKTEVLTREIAYVLARVMPPGTAQTALYFFQSTQERPIRVLVATSLITLWTSSGVMMSWMLGFRNAYGLPKTWGLVKERLVAFGLVFAAGIPLAFATVLVAFGQQIEHWAMFHAGHEFKPYILLLWTGARWLIAILTSVAVIALIYHHAVPRTLRWHSVIPGALLASAVWFPATVGFGWYVSHLAKYNLFYGSLTSAVVLLVWMYIVSIIVLIGAEYNAILFPRLVGASVPAQTPPLPKVQVG